MRAPRWTLAAAATALVLPVAGPAFATAAVDGDTTFLAALSGTFTSQDDCEEEPADLDGSTLTEDIDTSETGTVEPCPEPDDETDPSQEPDEETGQADDQEPAKDEGPEALGGDDLEQGSGDDVDAELDAADEAEQLARGALVSRVAQCAPRGHDARGYGDLNHGAFVSAAARGQELDVNGASFDLATPNGVDALCELFETDPAPDAQTQSAPQRDTGDNRPTNPGRGKDKDGPPSDRGGGPPAEKGAPNDNGNKGGNGNAGSNSNAGGQAGPGNGNGGGPPEGAGNGRGGPKR